MIDVCQLILVICTAVVRAYVRSYHFNRVDEAAKRPGSLHHRQHEARTTCLSSFRRIGTAHLKGNSHVDFVLMAATLRNHTLHEDTPQEVENCVQEARVGSLAVPGRQQSSSSCEPRYFRRSFACPSSVRSETFRKSMRECNLQPPDQMSFRMGRPGGEELLGQPNGL